ncbi:hypothetical protein V6N13_060227 [Hibiscus sabdariffa]
MAKDVENLAPCPQVFDEGLRGKFAAEIRDPFNKKRQWLSTYCTMEEAVAAYQTRKRGYKMMAAAENKSPSSPSSVLDVSVDAIQVEANRVVGTAVGFGLSWDELFGRCGLENHMSNLHNHLLLNDNVKLIDLP